MDRNISPEDKRLETLAAETEKNKKSLVAQLRRTPIVQAACERLGIGRSTYYKWRSEDRIFARSADHSLEAGRFLVNDMAESQLIRMIQAGSLGAIVYWLKHNNPRYANRIIHEYEYACNLPSAEEIYIAERALSDAMASKIFPKATPEELKERSEQEFRDEEDEKKIEDKLNEYNEDTQGK